MMYRLAYRNFGDHEALVANHTVATDGNTGATAQTGIAWYEIRSPGQTPVVHQQGTSADADGSTFQWMASLAMDRQGNIGMGYSTGSATKYPSINYNGRLADRSGRHVPLCRGHDQGRRRFADRSGRSLG